MFAVDHDRLPMWVVIDNPSDFPGRQLARCHYSLPNREATEMVIIGSLPTIRSALASHGYTCIGRQPEDDPVIVEVWL